MLRAMTLEEYKTRLLEQLSIHPEYDWMVMIFLILLVTGLLSIAASICLTVFGKRLTKTKTKWDDIALEAARKPLKVLVWIYGISYAIGVIYEESQAEIFKDIISIRDVAIVLMLAWGLVRFIREGEKYYIEKKKRKKEAVDLTTVNAISKLLRISVTITAVLITLQNLGVSISGLLAFGGVGGLAVGFAAKDMLANFFGALIIYFDKPFKVGDWIRSPDQEIEGTVEEIGWRMTTIRTFDKRPLYVPNSVFTNISVENPSRMTHRRIYETIGIRYDDIGVMDLITADVKQMLLDHEAIDESQTMIVNFNKFNDSSCDFFVYTFTHTTNWIKYHEIKHDVLLKIAQIIDHHKAEIAYPTQTEYAIHRDPEAEHVPLEILRSEKQVTAHTSAKGDANGGD